MLKVRNLDDQTYAEIVENAEGRLPWICPEWTNHNASDPGITILELMAWYKELQQYHLNKLTDALRLKLLKLAGASPKSAVPAVCGVFLGPERRKRPALERLHTSEDIPFELVGPLPETRPVIGHIGVFGEGRPVDVTELCRDRRVSFSPFVTGSGRGDLRIGFSRIGDGDLDLWFFVAEPAGVARNAFEKDSPDPRVIRWTCEGAEETTVVCDGTHALSVTGKVTVRHTGAWPAGDDGLHWLRLELLDPGCEEEVKLTLIREDMYLARQRETWAKTHRFTVEPGIAARIEIDDAQARDGVQAVFLRMGGKWVEADEWKPRRRDGGLTLTLDARGADGDGRDNVLVVSLDQDRADKLLFDAKGLPEETFFLRLEGRTALTDEFLLLCNTLMEDGTVSPAIWRCVDDLYRYGPRDRVFTYDETRETVTFGDGEHGALLSGGPGAILAAELTVTYCAGGAIPEDAGLWFDDDGGAVAHTAASGGTPRETVADVRSRLICELETSRKCVSAGDYQRIAALTPGLRVKRVKAIPGYDPNDPAGVSRFPVVTVVAAPAGASQKAMPDERFLDAVRRQLGAVRPIGMKVYVAAPEYIDIDVALTVRGGEEARERIVSGLQEYFEKMDVGGTVLAGDVAAVAQAAPGVLQVRRTKLLTPNSGCVQTSEGDLRLPRTGIPCLRSVKLFTQGTESPREQGV